MQAKEKKIDLLAIYGSPRKGGNTDVLLDAFVSTSEQEGATVQRVYARDLNISYCHECRLCEKTGRCMVEDDMQEVLGLLEKARGVVVACPIFFY